MLETTLETSVTIPLPIAQVHAYMTTPDHWAAASPITDEIRGDHTDRPAVVGTRFIDVLRLGPDSTVEVAWTVTHNEPGVAWQVTTDPPATADPADGRVHITLTYLYSDSPIDGSPTNRIPADRTQANLIPADRTSADRARTDVLPARRFPLSAAAGSTVLTRIARAAYPGSANLPLSHRDAFTNQSVAAHFLAAMRDAMLRVHTVSVPEELPAGETLGTDGPAGRGRVA